MSEGPTPIEKSSPSEADPDELRHRRGPSGKSPFGKANEAAVLDKLICQKARNRNDAASQEAFDPFDAFVEYRFRRPLKSLRRRGPWYGRAFTGLSIAAIVGALASSSIAAGGDDPSEVARWAVLVLGLFVAGVTALNQIWKPGQRSVRSYQATSSLRRLGWEFVHERGRFAAAGKDETFAAAGGDETESSKQDAKGLFIDEVMSIQAQAEAIDHEVPLPTSEPTQPTS
jgi:hypothetical protein